MFGVKRYLFSGFALLPLSIAVGSAFCGQLSTSTEVQRNIATLQQTKSCPQCDLSGADLNRMDLSGANLEGANLSRAKLNLANLTGANLRHADLREVGFGGADLADADLRGADLRGTSFAGAYMNGVLLDGEMVTTKPYVQEQISNVEETIYVEDTVKAKTVFKTDEMSIGPRRDFEEIPPVLPVPNEDLLPEKRAAENGADTDSLSDDVILTEAVVPEQSAAAPEAKTAPSIQQVRMPVPEENATVSIAQDNRDAQVEGLTEEKIEGEAEVLVTPLSEDQDSPAPPEKQEVVEKEYLSEKLESGTEVSQDVSLKVTEEEGRADLMQNSNASTGEQKNVLSLDSEVLGNVELLLETNQCYGCNLEGADLSGKNLKKSDLEGANLRGANLKAADLEGVNLKGANLSGADLRKADLEGADLYKADLSGADLTDASLDKALMDDAVFSGVKGYQQGLMLEE